jgi:putative ABC transport system permease protein
MVGVAIDLDREHTVGTLHTHIVAGVRPLADAVAGRGVWIGQTYAERAGLSVGDVLFLRARNRHGVENLYDAPLAGIFSYGYPALDEAVLYVDLTTATELLDLDGGVTHVVARTTDGTVRPDLLRTIEAATGTVSVRPWHDFARTAVSAVEGDTAAFGLMIAILYLLIVLGILNAMSMSVHERTREIGTLRAIGMPGRWVMQLVAIESVWQSAIAAVAAAAITAPLIWWLTTVGVDIAASMPAEMPVPFGERLRADIRPWHYLFTITSGVATALAGAIIPGRRAARIVVADAMRDRG